MAKDSSFVLQWHITNDCEKNCGHCYMTVEERTSGRDLSLKDCMNVIDDFVDFTILVEKTPRINFTGGDPLLRTDFWDILAYARGKGVVSAVMGNPDHITSDSTGRLKDNNIFSYQLSLDGLEEKHDKNRGRGDFKKTLDALWDLKTAGVPVAIMSTVTRQNQGDMPGLARLVANAGVRVFSFAREIPVGNGISLANAAFTPEEYRDFLSRMFETYKTLVSEGIPASTFNFKDPLWNLLFFEKGVLRPQQSDIIYDGCNLGINGLTLDADGTIYGCRRLAVPLGNIRENTFRDAFFHSDVMDAYRDFNAIEGCGACEILAACRGCRAISFGMTGSYMARDPQCWKGMST